MGLVPSAQCIFPKYVIVAQSPSCVRLFVTLWTAARQASLRSHVLGDWNDDLLSLQTPWTQGKLDISLSLGPGAPTLTGR